MRRNYKQATKDEVKQCAEIGKKTMQAVLDTAKPDTPVLDYYYNETIAQAKKAITACDAVLAAIAEGKDEDTCRNLMFSDSNRLSAAEQCFRADNSNIMRVILLEKL